MQAQQPPRASVSSVPANDRVEAAARDVSLDALRFEQFRPRWSQTASLLGSRSWDRLDVACGRFQGFRFDQAGHASSSRSDAARTPTEQHSRMAGRASCPFRANRGSPHRGRDARRRMNAGAATSVRVPLKLLRKRQDQSVEAALLVPGSVVRIGPRTLPVRGHRQVARDARDVAAIARTRSRRGDAGA